MIDVLGPVTAAAHSGCVECDPNDDRGDDLYVFALGGYTIRLCRHHLAMLEESLARCIHPDRQAFPHRGDLLPKPITFTRRGPVIGPDDADLPPNPVRDPDADQRRRD